MSFRYDFGLGIGKWPLSGKGDADVESFRKNHFERHRLTGALLFSVDSVLNEDPSSSDLHFFNQLENQDDLDGLATLNPRHTHAAERALKFLENPRCRGIQLYPTIHHYKLCDEPITRFCEQISRTCPNTIIRIGYRMDDYRMRPNVFSLKEITPTDVHCLVVRFPKINFVVSGVVTQEAKKLLGNQEDRTPLSNLYLDTMFIDGMDPINDLIAVHGVPQDRILWNTGEPFLHAAAAVLQLRGRPLPPWHDAIAGRNALQLINRTRS